MNLIKNVYFHFHSILFAVMEQRNIFRSLQLPGSKPGDPNWEYARWGFKDLRSLIKDFIGDESSDDEKSDKNNKNSEIKPEPSTAIDVNSLQCFQPFLNDPNQRKHHFSKRENTVNQPNHRPVKHISNGKTNRKTKVMMMMICSCFLLQLTPSTNNRFHAKKNIVNQTNHQPVKHFSNGKINKTTKKMMIYTIFHHN